ncbi:hypothetical protein FNW02_32370 [Komarekiella sp. 'clone 1']|uniref:Uncharacterized protein n=1 Tax=Komarekiella delphini-convector SJRDD-AB1 TaxID=2593771 RepID=A0AA40VUM2_9NOST|nr:hypothetical protein [Komarekiella delphini-convector]MBD6620354.1 hypothetical protein [Komarekiella delphini-convector SJRDD-AB1]
MSIKYENVARSAATKLAKKLDSTLLEAVEIELAKLELENHPESYEESKLIIRLTIAALIIQIASLACDVISLQKQESNTLNKEEIEHIIRREMKINNSISPEQQELIIQVVTEEALNQEK